MPGRTKKKVATKTPARDENLLTTDHVVAERRLMPFQAVIIIALGLWIYWPAIHGDWLWDDRFYVTENPLLKDAARLWKAWFQPGSFVEYYPLEQTVRWLQWQLWHDDTFGYHLTNVVLHITNALLVWRLLSKFRLRQAWIGGLIFVAHPMNVESVAWISELKNTLSLAPFILAMCFWIDYGESRQRRDYLLALGFFLIAMLCKISMAMFPFVILLYAWWRHRRLGWRDLIDSVPFFVVSLVLGILTIESAKWFMQGSFETFIPAQIGGGFSRLALGGLCILFYLFKVVWPVDLMPLYHPWNIDPPALWQFYPWVILAALLGWFWSARKTWGRHLILGLGFFLLNIAPFVNSAYTSYAWVMDHLVYLPMVGLVGLAAAAVDASYRRFSHSSHVFISGAVVLIAGLLALHAHWYSAAFTSDETLWSYEVERNPLAWPAYDNLGKVLLQAKDIDKARQQFETAIRLRPDVAETYSNLSGALAQLGRTQDALTAVNAALKLDPFSPEANNNLGILLAQGGHLDDAINRFKMALHRHPTYVDAHNNLGNALLLTGHIPEAIEQFQLALQTDPYNLNAHDNLALALVQSGKTSDAVDQFKQALEIDPMDPKATDGLAKLSQGASSGR